MSKKNIFNHGSIEFALRYPFQTDNESLPYENAWFAPLFFIFGLVTIVPFIVLLGYITTVRQAAAIGRETTPQFSDFNELFKEGANTLQAYGPLIAFILLSLFGALIGFEFMLGLIPIVLYVFPAVGIIYSMKRKYKIVYSETLLKLITNKKYFVAYVKNILILVFFIPLFIFTTVFSFGLALLVYLPVLLYSRPAYWGHVYSDIRKENSDLP